MSHIRLVGNNGVYLYRRLQPLNAASFLPRSVPQIEGKDRIIVRRVQRSYRDLSLLSENMRSLCRNVQEVVSFAATLPTSVTPVLVLVLVLPGITSWLL